MLTATVCIALSGAGLAVSFLTAYRRRFLRATRLAAWSLLPVGLYMTGLLPLGQKIGKAVGKWGADLVFKPTVWAGIGVLALAVILYVISRIAGRHTAGRPRSRGPAAVGGGGGVPAVAPTASTAALAPTSRPEREPARRQKSAASGDDGLSDFKEIEDILRRRGI